MCSLIMLSRSSFGGTPLLISHTSVGLAIVGAANLIAGCGTLHVS